VYSQGIAVVTGWENATGTGRAWRSTDKGVTWSDPVQLPVRPECFSGHCTEFPKINALGDVVLAHQANTSGQSEVQYAPVKLQGETGLFDPTGIALGTASNPVRVDPTGTTAQPVNGTVTSNQGTAAAGTSGWPTTPVQGATLFNTQTTGAANTAVTATIAAAAGTRAHLYAVDASCSAGTSSVTVQDGATTIWSTTATEVGTSRLRVTWNPGLTGTTNTAMTVTLAACGVGNTGTLAVQADRF